MNLERTRSKRKALLTKEQFKSLDAYEQIIYLSHSELSQVDNNRIRRSLVVKRKAN